MDILNWHFLNIDDIYFGKNISYTERKPLRVLCEGVSMPFGFNVSDKKTTVKFEIGPDNPFLAFLKKIDDAASKLYPGENYVPLVKAWGGSFFFLATVVESKNGVLQLTANGSLDGPVDATLYFRYVWRSNNFYGITTCLTRISGIEEDFGG